ncbi:MAG TPA: HAMP domain-containing sensor histidine kinase [Acidimicrobiales bacterium]|nr:HAMP domain-containing sensor histidine kinase [Acidimicrobiales bacterium]
MSLRARVLAGLALVAVVLAIVLAVLTRTTEANLVDQVDAQLADAVGPVRGFGPDHDRDGPPEEEGDHAPTPLYVGQVDGDLVRTVVTPDLSGENPPLPQISAGRALAAAQSGEPFTTGSEGDDLRYRARAFEDHRLDTVVVLALPLDSVDDAVAGLITVEALGAVVIVLTLGLVGWWVIRLGIRPVKAMTSVATAIAGGDLSQRVPDAHPGTEAGELGDALNRMLGRIEAAFEERTRAESQLRQFVADASHELRTPVATIRGYAELYRTGGLGDADALDDAMRRTEQEATRMGRLVDDLLALARLDQGRPLDMGPVELAHLAEDAARDARAIDPDRPVEAITTGGLVVTGDEQRLRQVIANVVGNALVHTPPGTPVEIRTFEDGGAAVVEITDHGPGMSPEVAARAFERFYRADPARSRHRGGSGLGLAIVNATVEAHGGTTQLDTAPGRGTTVRLRLPAVRPGGSPGGKGA